MDNKTEEEFLITGVLPDQEDKRDYIFTSKLSKARKPVKIDLRNYAGEIEDQLHTGSCVANAACSALELMTSRTGKITDLSRLFVYWNVRAPYSYLKGKDKGSYLRDAFKSINKFGVPDEKDWDFIENKVNEEPPKEVFEKAKNNKVLEYRRINKKDIESIKAALIEGYPVIFSAGLGKKFIGLKGPLKNQRYIPVNPWTNKLIGYHAMTIVGYDDQFYSFIVENSWSEDWGDNGFCHFPYRCLERDGLDVWVCTNFEYNGAKIDPKPEPEPDPNDENDENDTNTNEKQFKDDEVLVLRDIISFFKHLKSFFKR